MKYNKSFDEGTGLNQISCQTFLILVFLMGKVLTCSWRIFSACYWNYVGSVGPKPSSDKIVSVLLVDYEVYHLGWFAWRVRWKRFWIASLCQLIHKTITIQMPIFSPKSTLELQRSIRQSVTQTPKQLKINNFTLSFLSSHKHSITHPLHHMQ